MLSSFRLTNRDADDDDNEDVDEDNGDDEGRASCGIAEIHRLAPCYRYRYRYRKGALCRRRRLPNISSQAIFMRSLRWRR